MSDRKAFPEIAGSVSPREMQAIGEFVVAWSTFEFCVRQDFRHLTGMDGETSGIITSRLGSRMQRELLFDLLKSRLSENPDELDALRRYEKTAKILEGHRNTIVHSVWWGKAPVDDIGPYMPLTEKPRRGSSQSSEERFSADRLRRLSKRVRKLTDEISSLVYNAHLDA